MTTILVKDKLRQSVEAQSGGRQTVLYTAKGQPTFMTILQKRTMGELFPGTFAGSSDLHPAFIVNGNTVNQLMVGTYWGSLINGELVSQPYTNVVSALNGAVAFSAATGNGTGHHIMTWSERALINSLISLSGSVPYAGASYGLASDGGTAIRADGKTAGDTTAVSGWLSGTGPVNWRHDSTFAGVSDIHFASNAVNGAGGIHPIYTGLRMFANEVQMLPNNNAAAITDISTLLLADRSAQWKAVSNADGSLIDYTWSGSAGTDLAATTAGSVRSVASASVTVSGTNSGLAAATYTTTRAYADFNTGQFANNLGSAALKILQKYGLYPTTEVSSLAGYPGRGSCNYTGTASTSVSAVPLYCGFASPFGYAFNEAYDISGRTGPVRPCYYS